MSKVIEATGIVKTYRGVDKDLTILDGIDLSVNAGDFIGVVGESGTGKSTLLNILGGLDRPTAGSVRVDGSEITILSENRLARIRNESIGFIFQNHSLLIEFTALENLIIPYLIYNYSRREAVRKAEELLDKVDILDRKNHLVGEMSGGEMQRTAVARAMMCSPSVILADEPTGNLDEDNSENVFDLLHNLAVDQKTAVIVVTHNLHLSIKFEHILHLKQHKIEEL